MQTPFQQFLAASEKPNQFAAALKKISLHYGIVQVTHIVEGNAKKLLPHRKNIPAEPTYVIHSSEGQEICIYQNEPSNKDVCLAIGEIVLLRILRQDYKDKLSHARYIQFSTGFPNAFGYSRLIQATYTKKDLLNKWSCLAMDVKGFALTNRRYGMNQGNLVIKAIANAIHSHIEEGEVFGHLGGDSFVALIKNEHLERFLQEVSNMTISMQFPDQPSKTEHHFSLRVGIRHIDDSYNSYDDYVSSPMMAVSYAKTMKLSRVVLDKNMRDQIEQSKLVEATIDEEIRKKHFVIYYQPKVDLRTGQIIGAEALARWKSGGKVLPPAAFVPALEVSGDITKLDLYVLEHACHDIGVYKRKGHQTVPLSCNISRIDLRDPKIEETIVSMIKKHKLSSDDIIIEVTETTDLEEKERMQAFISYLKQHNVKTSIDDFGTGYSSLSALRDLEVSEIKIDRSFINRTSFTASDEIIISSIIQMAKKLAMNVICEGVETPKQVDLLKGFGCYQGQGYLYDKPLPKEEFEARLKVGFYPPKSSNQA